MTVVAKDEFRGDAADFAGGAGALHVREVVEESPPCRPSPRPRRDSAGPSFSSSATSRMNCRAASSQQSASASGKVTPWRDLWKSFTPSASVAVITCLSVHSQSCMALASVQAPVPGRFAGQPAHLGDPLLELREEQLVRHGDGKLQTLHGFRAFVGGFQLRIHPFLAEEAGAILRDAVAAHEADGFAHHVRAVAGVPEFARGAKHIGQRIENGVIAPAGRIPDPRRRSNRVRPPAGN